MNKQIIRFPKDGQASLAVNEWQVWDLLLQFPGNRH